MRSPLLFALAVLVSPLVALAQPFSYQGRLSDDGVLANGLHGFTFELWDDETAGVPVGPVLFINLVQVTDGLFTVMLDFGPGVIDGLPRWLKIGVKDGLIIRPLSPRQLIGNTPVAITSLDNEVARDGDILRIGDGNDRILLNRSTTIDETEYFGVETPFDPGAFGGMFVNTLGPLSRPFYGYAVGRSSKAITYYDAESPSWVLSFAGVDRFVVSSDGDVEAADYVYTAPQTRYLSIAPQAFRPEEDGVGYQSSDFRGRSALKSGNGDMVATVSLPHGAIVTRMEFHYVDDTSLADLTATLSFRPFLFGVDFPMGKVTTFGNSSTPRTSVVSEFFTPLVQNDTLCYYLRVHCPAWEGVDTTAIMGVQITYTIAGP